MTADRNIEFLFLQIGYIKYYAKARKIELI